MVEKVFQKQSRLRGLHELIKAGGTWVLAGPYTDALGGIAGQLSLDKDASFQNSTQSLWQIVRATRITHQALASNPAGPENWAKFVGLSWPQEGSTDVVKRIIPEIMPGKWPLKTEALKSAFRTLSEGLESKALTTFKSLEYVYALLGGDRPVESSAVPGLSAIGQNLALIVPHESFQTP